MTATPSVDDEQLDLAAGLKSALRRLAGTVAIVTSRDSDGRPHGMAATAVVPVSMEPPSMLVAVNRTAGLHPVLLRSGRYCINLLSDAQHALLGPFSQTALREQRFQSGDWRDVAPSTDERLPWLPAAPASIECVVEQTLDHGTHTLFIGRVTQVRCAPRDAASAAPMVWLGGQPVRIARLD